MPTSKKSFREALTAWASRHPWTLLAVATLALGPWWLAYFAFVLRFTRVVAFWMPQP